MTENIDIKIYDIESLGLWLINLTDMEISEGDIVLAQHLRRERNSKIVRLAKERFKTINNGKLFCEVCEFDFEKKYGSLGIGFIEAHHKKPISKMKPGDITKIEDFLMVCSNCHSMLHLGDNCITHEMLKLKIDKQV